MLQKNSAYYTCEINTMYENQKPLRNKKNLPRINKISPLEKWRNKHCQGCTSKCNVTEDRFRSCIFCDLINIVKTSKLNPENLKAPEVDKC